MAETPTSERPRRRWRKVLLAFVISGLLVALLLSQVDPADAWARVKGAETQPLLWALGVSFLIWLCRTARYHTIATRTGVLDVAAATSLQVAANRLAPMRLGELSLPWLMHRASGEPPVPILVRLLLIRLIELWVLLASSAVAIGLWFGEGEGLSPLAGAAVLLALTLSLFAFRRLVRLGVVVGRALVARTPLRRVAALPTILDKVEGAVDDAARLSPARRAAVFGLSAAVMGLNFVMFGCLIAALGIELAPPQVVVGVAASQVSGALPVLSVGSVGTHETGWVAGFAWVGLPVPEAVVSGLFTQVVSLGFAVLWALPGAAWAFGRRAAPEPATSAAPPSDRRG